MAKSRKSKRARRSRTGGYQPPDRPYRSITGQMTAADFRAVEASADAALQGDFTTALRLHRSVPMFSRSTHGDRLQQLAELGDSAPGWLVSRWLTILARRREWTGGDDAAIHRVLQVVVPIVHPDHIPFERIGCDHVEQVMPFINERDWVVRQVDLYELGALRQLVEHHVGPGLAERADQIDAWCTAPMRALRIEQPTSTSDALRLTDLSDSSAVEVLDLGLGEQLDVGQHVLGRVVPTVEPPGALFEWQPLPVPERVAQAVATAPRRWLPTLHRLAMDGALEPAYSHLPEASPTSDLVRHAWMGLAGIDGGPDDHDPRHQVEAALREALARAAQGEDAVRSHRHRISELILDPHLTEAVRARFVHPGMLRQWQLLAQVLPAPARERCQELAMWCDALPDAIA